MIYEPKKKGEINVVPAMQNENCTKCDESISNKQNICHIIRK